MSTDGLVRSQAKAPGRGGQPVCVRELDADWRITHVNDAHCALYACGPDDLIGREAWSLMVDSFAADEQRQFLKSLMDEQPVPEAFFCTERAHNGELLTVRVDWAYRRNSDGEVIGFIWWPERLGDVVGPQTIPGGQPYRELLGMMHDGVGLVHRNGSFIFVNERLCEILGVRQTDLIGRSVFLLGDEEGKQVLVAARAAAMTSGRPGEIDRCEITHRHPNGTRMCLSVSGHGVSPQAGLPIAGLIVVSDMTDRWRAETMRRRQAQIFDEIHDVVLVLNTDRIIVDCNAAAEQLFGFAKGELVGRHGRSLHAADAAAAQDAELSEALRESGRWSGEIKVRRWDGSEGVCDVTVGPIRGRAGQTIGFISVSRDITKRKATEKALSESEERYRQLVEMQSDTVIVQDGIGKILFANSAAARLYGAKSVADLKGRNWLDLLLPEKREAAIRRSREVLENRSNPSGVESRRRRLDGRIVDVEASARRVNWGGKAAVMGIVRDITDRKRAENALRESEAKFRNLVSVSIQGYAIIGADWRVLFCNDAIARIFGYSDAEEMKATVASARLLCADDDKERIRRASEAVLKGLGSRNLEFEGIRRDGSPIWLSTAIGLVDWQGGPAIQAAVVDMSQRREAELALQTSEAKLRSVTDALPGFVNYIDQDHCYQFNNRTYEEWFGIPRDQLRGTPIRELIGEVEYARIRPWLDSGLAGRTTKFEVKTGSDGSRTLRGTFVPDFDPRGGVRGVISYISDVSERKNAENALKQAHEDLRRANDEAIRANAAKSRFLASASHDLRQPLQASNLFLAALAEAKTPGERDEIVSDLGTALITMRSLLNALLDVSKLDAEVVDVNVTDFNLRGMLSQLAAEFGVQAQAKGLEMRSVASGITVRTDPSLLGRVLGNFLANAVQHTERGKVLMGCRRVGDCVRIAVLDTGCGIPEEARELIFEEFYQHGRRRRDRNTGLGLGLSIAQRTARLLGHRIHVSSKVGKGSMFAVDVPLGSAAREAEEAERWSQLITGDIAGATIVVLEDDDIVRRATERLLKGWGAVVMAYEGSAEAMEEIGSGKHRPDVLVVDYQLVDETGTDAAAKIRRICGRDVPAIVITGDPTAERMTEIRASGATAMSKPVSPAELRLLVRNILREPA